MNRTFVLSTILVTSILLALQLIDLDYSDLSNNNFGWILAFVLILIVMCYVLFFKLNNSKLK
ncbi:hypothetical protein [Psychroserpens sp.]|uniref:hypothetical protein n=1 Tax=Psychroserpens sp. TaxID=2020870 RepID=UPI001B02FF62|nr:hypothetical protein [Psychroserpens sp.]MBO6606781.1 hypothetical protein [Psychroserpens sp.]MBO6631181.1 hypothetical protein [Psychroserpens sp.]MBO6653484.1 hypothetical protein [Psychroserpens sp.]MBO6680488.1 hypothetical protein [Psychroserpens sp.]MBO6750553.1 hypothetical protein [Psychroserpens sp.]